MTDQTPKNKGLSGIIGEHSTQGGFGLRKRARIAPPPPPPSPEIPPPPLPPRPAILSLAYDERPVIKLDLPEPPDDEIPQAPDLEKGEYLLREVPATEEQESPHFQVMPSASPKDPDLDSAPEDDRPITLAEFLQGSRVQAKNASSPKATRSEPLSVLPVREETDYPEIWPSTSPVSEYRQYPPTLPMQDEIELSEFNQPQEEIESEVDELAEKIKEFKLTLKGHDYRKFTADKEAYINKRLNPTDPKEKARLEHRLKIYTYPDSDDVKTKQDAETKREKLRQELEREFEEHYFLEHEQGKILQKYVEDNYKKPEKNYFEQYLAPRIVYASKHYMSRKGFYEEYREKAPLEALKLEIRKKLTPEERQELDILEEVQADIDKPTYKARLSQLPSYQTYSDAEKATKQAKPIIEQLCKEQQLLCRQRDPSLILAEVDDERRKELLHQFTLNLAIKRANLRNSKAKEGECVALDARTKKPFKPLGSKP